MKSWDVVGYVYRADIWCPECAFAEISRATPEPDGWNDRPEDWHAIARLKGIVGYPDESTYDSDDFPKVIFADSVEDDERCGTCFDPLIPS